tara:strand:+ start:419 stop:994 length:576 start_codon:yes stop_codon:yes gene_type:complete
MDILNEEIKRQKELMGLLTEKHSVKHHSDKDVEVIPGEEVDDVDSDETTTTDTSSGPTYQGDMGGAGVQDESITEEASIELTDVDLKNISQNESDWLKDDWDELDDQIKNIYKADEEFAGCMDGDDGLEEQRRRNCRDIFGRMNGGQKRNVLRRIGDFFRNLRWPKWMRKLNPFEKEMRSKMGGKKWRQHR